MPPFHATSLQTSLEDMGDLGKDLLVPTLPGPLTVHNALYAFTSCIFIHARELLLALRTLPRVDDAGAACLEIAHVSGHHVQAMTQGGGGKEPVG